MNSPKPPTNQMSLDNSALSLLAMAAKTLHPAEEDGPEHFEDRANKKTAHEPATPEEKATPSKHAAAAIAEPAAPTTRPNRTRAEQSRREELEKSLTECLPIENLRAVEKMNEHEVQESKKLLICFLSGRAPQDDVDEKNAKSFHNQNEEKDAQYVRNYQHDLSNLSRAYHYTHDPSLPLPTSLLDRMHPHQDKKHISTDTQDRDKKKKRKPKNDEEDNLLTMIDYEPLLWVPQQNEMHCAKGEDEGACEPTNVMGNVPVIVNIEQTSTENVLDESCRSSVAADEASILTPNTAFYLFEYDKSKKGWECKRCCSVHPHFQAMHALIEGSSYPSPRLMHLHKHACLGVKADLTKALDVVLNLIKSSNIKFKQIASAEFQSIVRIAACGKEEFVSLFTTDLRNRWVDPVKHKLPSSNIDWSKYPVQAPQAESREKLIEALVTFAKKMGLGFDFVANEHFVELFRLISPKCCLPSTNELISCW